MTTYNEEGTARLLSCSRALLRKMRREGRGPRFTRVGRLVRYPEVWLVEYLENNASQALGAGPATGAPNRPQGDKPSPARLLNRRGETP